MAEALSLHPLLQWAVALLLVIGGSFCLIGAIGLVRFADFYTRLHAPTKPTTLGVGGLLMAAMLAHAGADDFALRELLVMVFLFVTAPVSAHLLGQAALRRLPPEDEALAALARDEERP